MYQIGDFVIYGGNGVCRVDNIGPLNNGGVSKDVKFYTLVPYYLKGSKIFTPVDSTKVLMRAVISKEEATQLIHEIGEIDTFMVTDEKKREEIYKEALRTCDCRELVSIIKTLYYRRQERLAQGKKVTASDDRYFHMAEENLYGELAITLGMTKDEVREYITHTVENETESASL